MRLFVAALGLLVALQTPNADQVAARLHAYLLAYEPKLSELIADERMKQETAPAPTSTGFDSSNGRREQRDLTSEVAFIALPANAGWMGFRRVLKVGRDTVCDGTGSLRNVLASGEKTDYAKAKELLSDSARFNLGEARTTNLPNLPLEMLHPRHAKRFSVRVAGEERIRGVRTTKLVFVEIFSPTIIKHSDGGDMRSIISAWVEPANGRLHRADVYSRDVRENAWPFDAVLSVDFTAHAELGLLVPTKMREEFFAGHDRRAWGEASYTNYRRFQTSARILPQ
jgi:hypothetical protein